MHFQLKSNGRQILEHQVLYTAWQHQFYRLSLCRGAYFSTISVSASGRNATLSAHPYLHSE
jgi:hypothetical protein